MKYLRSTFSLPVNSKQMTDEEYEIAVGARCAACRHKDCKCPMHEAYAGDPGDEGSAQ